MEQARLFGGIGFVVAAVAAMGCPALNWDFQGAGGPGGASSATSASGSGGAPVSSSGAGGMGPASWNLYSFDVAMGKWSTVALSSVWTDTNAPPTKGIVAAAHLSHFNKLLVFADNGMFYLQDNGTWKPPVMTNTRFPQVVNPAALNTLYHVPSDWNVMPMMMPLQEGLNFVENPAVYVYNYFSDDTAQYVTTLMGKDEPPPGPKQASGKALWSFEVWNIAQVGMKEGFVLWLGYDDGYVYRLPADLLWERYMPADMGTPWYMKPGAPPWAGLQAAYFVGNPTNGIGVIYFIGP